MKRGILIGVLIVGAVAGLSAGFCRVGHAGWGHHRDFQERIAETCTDAALKVFEREHGSRHGGMHGGMHGAPPPAAPPPAAPPAAQ